MLRPILIAALFFSALNAQTWEWLRPYPQGNHLTCIATNSLNQLYAAGYSGTFIKTDDLGQTWGFTPYIGTGTGNSYSNVNDLQLLDDGTLIALRNDGYLVTSNDDGDTWEVRYNFGFSTSLHSKAMFFVDEYKGWVAQSNGHLYRTVDGGYSWESITMELSWVEDLFFINDSLGWACGWDGGVYRTDDGGTTWTEGNVQFFGDFYTMHFTSETNGWMLGTYGFFFHTEDGGLNWEEMPRFSNFYIYDVNFFDADNGWVTSSHGYVMHTTDGGESWEWTTTGDGDCTILDIQPVGLNEAWCVGSSGCVFYTTDGGGSWQELSEGSGYGKNNWTHFTSENQGFVVNDDSEILRTQDGGNTWETQVLENYVNLRSGWFLDELNGWVCGEHGRVYYTDDGGDSWVPRLTPESTFLFGIYFLDTANGYAVGNDGDYSSGYVGKIYKTTDGGQHWMTMGTFPNERLFNVNAFNETNVWVGGLDGANYHSSDEGNSWTEGVDLPLNFDVREIFFLNDLHGWLVGYSNSRECYHTSDGGVTWETQYLGGGNTTFETIKFIDELHGWAAGVNIVHTEDGGVSWQSITKPVNGIIRHLDMVSPEEIYFVGDSQMILRYNHTATGLDEPKALPGKQQLTEAFPNPFNASITFKVNAPTSRVEIFNLKGALVWAKEFRGPNQGITTRWNAIDLLGNPMTTGVYLVRVQGEDSFKVTKVVLIR